MAADFWMPVLDYEVPFIQRDLPDVKLVRKDGVWLMHVTARALSREQAEATARAVIAEAVTDAPVYEISKH